MAWLHADAGAIRAGYARCLHDLADPATAPAARYGLWQLCQILGAPKAALDHLHVAIAAHPVVVRPAETVQRRVLALAVPGDFQANLPLDALLDPATTELITLWLSGNLPTELPPFDCVFIAIAEDARHGAALEAADRLAASLGRTVVNSGARIARLSRDGAAGLLDGIPDLAVPSQRRLPRAALAQETGFPMIARPVGAHAGQGLERLKNPAELAAYLGRWPDAAAFHAAPFVDFRSADGQWRKYRVVFVDGEPFPCHLAIHSDWAVWYYNANMAADAAKRAEEAQFLEDIEAVFPPPAMAALRRLAGRVGLDYFGLDCTLLPDGRVLVFEVETGMLVHAADSPEIFPYKARCVSRIFRAVERMIDARIADFRASSSR